MSDDRQLATELASLRIARDPAPSSGGRGAGKWIALGLVLALLSGGAFLFTRTQESLFPEEVDVGAITLVSPAGQDVTLVATGYVYARRRATIAPKIIGRITKLLVDEGAEVKENELVAELEPADAHAQLLQVRADVASAEARAERARADLAEAEVKLAREKDLLQRGAGTRASVDDAQARQGAIKAQLSAAQAEIAATRARQGVANVALENTKVRAPFAATVLRKLAEVGEVVTPGGQGLGGGGIFLVAGLDDLEVQADVSEAQLSKVKVGTPGEIILDAFPDRRFRAQVRDIRRTVDRAKASVTVKVNFIGPTEGVLPDMSAKVSFLAKALDEAALKAAPKLVVPADAVVERAGHKVVLVLDKERVREAPVTVKGTVGALLELDPSGPVSGTRVILHPPAQLHDGSSAKEHKR